MERRSWTQGSGDAAAGRRAVHAVTCAVVCGSLAFAVLELGRLGWGAQRVEAWQLWQHAEQLRNQDVCVCPVAYVFQFPCFSATPCRAKVDRAPERLDP